MATVPAPKTWAVQEQLTAALLNAEVRDALLFLLSPPKVSVYQTATTNMPTSGTAAVILFDTEEFDTDVMHDTTTNTGRLIAVTPGTYLVTATLAFAANATGYRAINVRKNAAGAAGSGTSVVVTRQAASPTSTSVISVSFTVTLIAADYLEMFGIQTSGGALASAAGFDGSKFQMIRMGS